jgi:hypothetical protein
MTYNQGEIVYDETNGTLRLLDGVTQGGIALANQTWTQQAIDQAMAGAGEWPVNKTTGSAGPIKIAIGAYAGDVDHGFLTVAIGVEAGKTSQGNNSISIGAGAGQISQGRNGLALGYSAGQNSQGLFAVALGSSAGDTNQGFGAVATGTNAGAANQGYGAVAVGYGSGNSGQGEFATAVGTNAGDTNQGQHAVSIGHGAGNTDQGIYAIAIGNNAGFDRQAAGTIILNAAADQLNGVANQTNRLYINPIRTAVSTNGFLQYNATTKEVTCSTTITAPTITAPTVTGLATFTGTVKAGNINNLVVNDLGGGGGALTVGSQIQIGNSAGAGAGVLIKNAVTNTLGGEFSSTLESGSKIQMDSGGVSLSSYTYNSISGSTGLESRLVVEVDNSYPNNVVRIGTRIINSGVESPTNTFQGVTISQYGNIATPGSITAASAVINGINLKQYIDSKVWLALAVGL